jgi:hypothetical protein
VALRKAQLEARSFASRIPSPHLIETMSNRVLAKAGATDQASGAITAAAAPDVEIAHLIAQFVISARIE